ncbi:RimJ/RimL family protein N-acetyltransferase [Nocardiopsis sp. Huas11]|uniref:GNAT family protein n=1 Tax=Nocardiopsis sp. Huas11 TaxID=2183912 RepID=UPI000EAE0A14|nr:GNAT family protein [Nocardiopsis sp. Huas11]RKS06863.1 RimJ/RimL family protein N-acetyltransferase [Nocardiopsis sp. Huas11]
MTRIIYPHVSTPLTRLVPTRVRFGDAVLDELEERGLSGLPSRDVFRSLWPKEHERVSAQFLIQGGDGEVVGYSSLHALGLNSRHVDCSVVADPVRTDDAVLAHAYALAINYAFAMWGVRKINFWTVERSLSALRAVSSNVVREGLLTEYVLDEGRLRDVSVFAVFRDDWDHGGAGFVEEAVGAGAAG